MNTQPSRAANRRLDGVSTPELVAAAFAAVESAFSSIWLSDPDGNGRLQRVWQRYDHLANLELYSLGVSILALQQDGHCQWLKRAVKEIRDSPKGHGFLTEIIVYSMVGLGSQRLTPAPPKNPAYDFSTSFSNGDVYYVSVKNHDSTDEAVEFTRQATSIRGLWRERLEREGRSLALQLISDKPLSSEDFELIRQNIQRQAASPWDWAYLTPSLKWMVADLPDRDTLEESITSDTILIAAFASPREQERFRKNIHKAAEKFRCVGRKGGQWNVVFMRVHALADIQYLSEIAKEILSGPETLVDLLLLYQPAYVRDEANRSLIHHTFTPVVSVKFARSRCMENRLSLTPAVGSVSISPSSVIAISEGKITHIPSNVYIYQQGDIYRSYPEDSFMSLSSPASGIRQHAVHQGEIHSDPGQAPHDDLLIL